jgi:hypothetical protein
MPYDSMREKQTEPKLRAAQYVYYRLRHQTSNGGGRRASRPRRGGGARQTRASRSSCRALQRPSALSRSMLRTLPLPCLPPLRVSEEAASRSRAAQCSRPSRRAVLRLHAVGGEGGGPPEPPLDAEARLESLEKRLRSRGAEPAARSERPLAGVPPKPLPVEPWSKRLEGKSGTRRRSRCFGCGASARVSRLADASATQRSTPPGCCGWARRVCCGGRTKLCVLGA